ncbi:MAG: hypothetical protein J0H05_11390 [Stenotrophomonas acidaminiphila]|nr:hypothetical protein [Stenotrophomonas acidaminiphila]OJY77724.1 MAG: hypothetical protein BGP18_05710 [Stenotrophomonas sp. 69-14]
MADLMQQARELLAAEYRTRGYSDRLALVPGVCRMSEAAVGVIADALRAASEREVVSEAWRLINSGGDQVGGLYSSEPAAYAAELTYRGNRNRQPYTVQRLEIIAARPQGMKDGR